MNKTHSLLYKNSHFDQGDGNKKMTNVSSVMCAEASRALKTSLTSNLFKREQ